MDPTLIFATIAAALTLAQFFWVHFIIGKKNEVSKREVIQVVADMEDAFVGTLTDIGERQAQLSAQLNDAAPKLMNGGVDPRDAVDAREAKKADRQAGAYAAFQDAVGPEWAAWAWENAVPADIKMALGKGVSGPVMERLIKPFIEKAREAKNAQAAPQSGGWN